MYCTGASVIDVGCGVITTDCVVGVSFVGVGCVDTVGY